MSRSTLLSALTALALGTALTGCAAAEETTTSSPSSQSVATPSPTEDAATPSPASPSVKPSEPATPEETADAVTTLAVKISGDKISPNAQSLELTKGEPLRITFDSDRGGELHVHSKPDQYVDFAAGTSQQRIVITTPGVVEIEDHDTGAVVAVVEVR